MSYGNGVVTASLVPNYFAPVEWLSLTTRTNLKKNDQVAFQVKTLRPKDSDADIWISGKISRVDEEGGAVLLSVNLLGDTPGTFEYPNSYVIKRSYVVPSRNFLLRRGARLAYFGDPRGKESTEFFWADRVIDTKGEFLSIQGKDVFRAHESDFLVVGFYKIGQDFHTVLFREPHTKDDSESDENIMLRLCSTNTQFLLTHFPVQQSQTVTRYGCCPFENLSTAIQFQITTIYNHVASLAYQWLKNKTKLKSYSEVLKVKTTVTFTDSVPISAHSRHFSGTDSIRTESTNEDIPVDTTTNIVTRKRKKDPKTATKVSKKVIISLSEDSDSNEDDPDVEITKPILPQTPKTSPRKPKSETPGPKSSPHPKTDTSTREDLVREVQQLRARELDSIKSALDKSEALRRAAEQDRDRAKAALEKLRYQTDTTKTHSADQIKNLTDSLQISENRAYNLERDLQSRVQELKELSHEFEKSKKVVSDLRSQQMNIEQIKTVIQKTLESSLATFVPAFGTKVSEEVSKVRQEVLTATSQIQVSIQSILELLKLVSLSLYRLWTLPFVLCQHIYLLQACHTVIFITNPDFFNLKCLKQHLHTRLRLFKCSKHPYHK